MNSITKNYNEFSHTEKIIYTTWRVYTIITINSVYLYQQISYHELKNSFVCMSKIRFVHFSQKIQVSILLQFPLASLALLSEFVQFVFYLLLLQQGDHFREDVGHFGILNQI